MPLPDTVPIESQLLGEGRVSTTSRKRSVVDFWTQVTGSGTCVMSVIARNFMRALPFEATVRRE